MRLGQFEFNRPIALAPMAGVTDAPFRRQCLHHGASFAVSEMLSSNPQVWATDKSQKRMDFGQEPQPRIVQIAGSEPNLMAEAAKHNVALGADIIDINMGCPAKKVNKKLAGSALLQYPQLVAKILNTVVNAVPVPVTLKIRTGWSNSGKNALEIANIAQDAGIQSLAIHGRTREDLFKGSAEFDTIATVKQAINIPVLANGDITTPEAAAEVLAYTSCDGLLIGRGAQGKPWLFNTIQEHLEHGRTVSPPNLSEQLSTIIAHVLDIEQFYAPPTDVRLARKHLLWYIADHDPDKRFRRQLVELTSIDEQIDAITTFYQQLEEKRPTQCLIRLQTPQTSHSKTTTSRLPMMI